MFNGNKLKKLREDRGLKQIDIAKLCNVGASTVSMWETGDRHPDDTTITKLANHFNVTTDYLLDNDATSKTINYIAENDDDLNQKLKKIAQDEFDRTLFKKYGDLSDEKKKLVMAVINGIIEEADKED